MLTNSLNQIYVSQISLIEIAIKQKIGKLPDFKVSLKELISQTEQDRFRIIRLDNQHIAFYDRIPLYADHRDPFDRLILATSLAEQMPLISADEKFSRYHPIVDVIW
jgi:PIN domain nuclease of toxin-antitoxin system